MARVPRTRLAPCSDWAAASDSGTARMTGNARDEASITIFKSICAILVFVVIICVWVRLRWRTFGCGPFPCHASWLLPQFRHCSLKWRRSSSYPPGSRHASPCETPWLDIQRRCPCIRCVRRPPANGGLLVRHGPVSSAGPPATPFKGISRPTASTSSRHLEVAPRPPPRASCGSDLADPRPEPAG